MLRSYCKKVSVQSVHSFVVIGELFSNLVPRVFHLPTPEGAREKKTLA